ncbi:lamin tail domain-containing protein [bacterium]|nr:lamin tail domain-containing protein [bacterium]NCQ54897.1 lamin tail domain-containing protein [Candidatus Parcubacteria bacterium]NCS66941.1 lamin tail domain-containing protein [Candidatus Peregrinibacteria bacterium]NCS95888.1 lamin tail domain-containing protein [bacterium]
MKTLMLIGVLAPALALAQTVQITEIAPHTLANEPEWFEFEVTQKGEVDLSEWQLSNDKNKPKPFTDIIDKIMPGEGVQVTENPLVFALEGKGYFVFSPSPIGLPNDGGTLQILNGEGAILNQINYPKAASRSTKDYEEREVLVWDEPTKQLKTINVRAPHQVGFESSKGQKNPILATTSTEFRALINEVSVDSDVADFIEIKIASGPEKINLQYTELKHNGTPLWYFEEAYFVSPGDILTFLIGTPDQGKAGEHLFHSNKRDGLSGGSGTVELISFAGTSQETWMDTLCWQKKQLSETERKRVQKFIEAGQWKSECVSIENLVPNQSVARPIGGNDNQLNTDWFEHFNGSRGQENTTKNQAPKAIITLQGSKKSVAKVSFLLNPTGEYSTDPDGPKDLKTFLWEFDQQFLSDQKNPAGFYIETAGEHELKLTVTDQSGESHTAIETIVGIDPGGSNSNVGSAKAQLAVVEQILQESLNENLKDQAQDDFFAVLLNRPQWKESLMAYHYESTAVDKTSLEIEMQDMYETDWPRQINLPKPVRQRLKKNLGLLFSWRESPWPGLTAEWSAVVEADRKFGYFDLVYRGF